MTTRIAINGFGRIGRLVMRSIIETGRDDVEIVAVNSPGPVETNVYLLKHDSVHGRMNGDIKINGDTIDYGRGEIRFSGMREPKTLPWQDLDVDVVMECTGIFNARDKAVAHLKNGSKRVLVSAPANNADLTVVYGINHDQLTADHVVVSSASCTTNCLAPVAAVLNEAFGIESGFMTTIHSYTGDQPALDKNHEDLYRTRAAAMNMIPTTTGAARAVGLVLPELKGKLDGVAIRVPTPNVSAVDLTFQAAKPVSVEAINDAMRIAANGKLNGILGFTDEKLVSTDFNHDPHSSIFHTDQTKVMEGGLCRVLSWYDNEWGFSMRMVDNAVAMGKLL